MYTESCTIIQALSISYCMYMTLYIYNVQVITPLQPCTYACFQFSFSNNYSVSYFTNLRFLGCHFPFSVPFFQPLCIEYMLPQVLPSTVLVRLLSTIW